MTRAAQQEFDPTAVRVITSKDNQPPADNDNAPSPFELISTEITDLFDEAIHWADGEAIADQATHDAIERLRDGIHDAGKRADALRVEEKRPLDLQVKEIQDRYNVYIAPKKGKVDLAKSTLDTLLTPWRTKIAQQKAAAAALIAEQAAAAQQAAQEALRATTGANGGGGNLAARVEAEEAVAAAARLGKQAARADKQATTGLGLRTVWRAELVDEEKGLEWWYGERPDAFRSLIQELADEAVRRGVRKIDGFRVFDEKVAN